MKRSDFLYRHFYFFLLIFSGEVFADSYYAYLNTKELAEIESHVPKDSIAPLFTQYEASRLKNIGVNPQVYKVRTPLTLQELQKSYPGILFERENFIIPQEYKSYQWYLHNKGGDIIRRTSDIDFQTIHAKKGEDLSLCHDCPKQSRKIRVAIVDSGIDLLHPDLAQNILKNPKECESLKEYKECLSQASSAKACHKKYATIDNNNNGYPLDCHGWSITNKSYPHVKVSGNPEVSDTTGHGTHSSGLIGAVHNSIGIDGVASNVELLPIQVASNASFDSPIESIVKGVLYAIENNADIINLSLGWRFKYDSQMMRDIIKSAVEKDILIVVAAGNQGHSDITYPCAYNDVICVGSHDESGEISSFSNKGTQVDLLAPGRSILSTWPTTMRSKFFTQDDNYEKIDGTSFSAPLVSGALAVLLSSGSTPKEARVKLLRGSREKTNSFGHRFGNADLTKAYQTSFSSFVYPLNKEAALINLGTHSPKFILKLKNYGKKAQNIKMELFPLNEGVIINSPLIKMDVLQTDQTSSHEIVLELAEDIISQLSFKLVIETDDSQDEFIIRADTLRIIHPKVQEKDITHISIDKKLSPGYSLKPFKNITHFNSVDFLAIRNTKKKKTLITLLKKEGDQYISSKEFNIREKRAVFLNFSKLDIDLDGKADYVVMYVFINKEDQKIMQFLIFDDQLQPKRYAITPRNQYNNENEGTFLPGQFKWMRRGDIYVPAWIGYGERGTKLVDSPWKDSAPAKGNFLYYLTNKGLENLSFSKGETPLHILYQTKKENKEGSFHFITTKSTGFFKQYFLNQYINGVKKSLEKIKLSDFFNISHIRPLPMITNHPSGFFYEQSNNGDQNIFTVKIENSIAETQFIKLKNTMPGESIKFINRVFSKYIFFQTNYHFGVYNRHTDKTHLRESKVNTRRQFFMPLTQSASVFLSSYDSPSGKSEVLQMTAEDNFLTLGKYKNLSINGCDEIGPLVHQEQDFIGFSCPLAQRVLFMKVQ